jgi:hypothetical protein
MKQFVLLNMEQMIMMIEYDYEKLFYQLKMLNLFLFESKEEKKNFFFLKILFHTSIFASECLILFNMNFGNKHIREVLVKLNGIQALFILSIRILIKSIECVDRRFIPFRKKKFF